MKPQWEALEEVLDECEVIDKEIKHFRTEEDNANKMVMMRTAHLKSTEASFTKKVTEDVANLLELIAQTIQFENLKVKNNGEKMVFIEPLNWANHFNAKSFGFDNMSLFSREDNKLSFAITDFKDPRFAFVATVPREWFSMSDDEIVADILQRFKEAYDNRARYEKEVVIADLQNRLVHFRREAEQRNAKIDELEKSIDNLKNDTVKD